MRQYRKEFKGSNLLDRRRFKWAAQAARFEDEKRRKCARRFFSKGLTKRKPVRDEFTAYGQACLEMARGIFRLLRNHDAALFAAAIPRGVRRPPMREAEEFLRKDHVFLLERYFYFLEEKQEHELLVMDQVEDVYDRRFVGRLEDYFTKTEKGVLRTQWIVPSPIFVSSAMSLPVQVADLCVYCINWGFRLPERGMDAPVRQEIAGEFGAWLSQLQYRGSGRDQGEVYQSYGIVFVSDPYSSR